MKRILLDYFQDILDSINDIQSFTGSIDFDVFQNNRMIRNAVIRSLEIMGEAAKNIPEDIRIQYPDIPWKRISGMRDKLIHGYFGVDYEMVWSVAKERIPEIKPFIEQLIERVKNG